jgi:hypothetical protein
MDKFATLPDIPTYLPSRADRALLDGMAETRQTRPYIFKEVIRVYSLIGNPQMRQIVGRG